MAKKHRKLFPSLSETNNTLDCSTGVCDTACPYNCYPPYSPDYNTISPQLPPQYQIPPISAPSPSIYDAYQEPSNSPISSDSVIVITVAAAFIAVLLTGFVIAAKFVSNRVNRVNREGDQSETRDLEESLNEEQVDHPIWFIRTIGLQQSIINSITICRYKRGDGLIERTDCPVCLNEFEEHESLRLLPKCNHAFHISCIDTWLRSHTNCPLCRASVVSSAASRSSAPEDASPGGGSVSQTENDGDGDGDGGEGRDGEQRENRAEQGGNRDETALKDPMSSSNGDSLNMDLNSDAQMEISRLFHESHQNLLERHGDESRNLDEPEREEQVIGFNESSDQNRGSSISPISLEFTQMENLDFPGKCSQEENQEPGRNNNTIGDLEENKLIGEQTTYSNENDLEELQSQRMSESMDSQESNSVAIDQTANFRSGISSNMSKQIGSSRFSRNSSSIFPL